MSPYKFEIGDKVACFSGGWEMPEWEGVIVNRRIDAYGQRQYKVRIGHADAAPSYFCDRLESDLKGVKQ